MPSALSAADVGAEGRMARCESCGTAWLARHFPDDVLSRGKRALPRQTLIIEGEIVRPRDRSAWATSGRQPPTVRGVLPREIPKPLVSGHARRKDRRLAAAIVAGGVILVAVVTTPILTALPGLAGLFADEPLAFAGVKSTFLRTHDQDAIVVEGELVNTTHHAVEVPAIRISLRDARSEEVFSWVVNPATAEVDAGAAIGFRSALASPAPGGDHVALSLAPRTGVAVGMR